MKVKAVSVFFVCMCLLFMSAFQGSAAADNYFLLKGGIYSPQSDDLADFNTGFNGEVAFGHHFNPNIALEFGLGYSQTDANAIIDGTLIKADIRNVPLTLSLKGVYPVNQYELYGLFGIGVYFTEAEVSFPAFGIKADDDDTPLGVHLGAGFNYNLSNNMFIGLEAKYFWADAQYRFLGIPLDVDLDGFVATLNIGFRF